VEWARFKPAQLQGRMRQIFVTPTLLLPVVTLAGQSVSPANVVARAQPGRVLSTTASVALKGAQSIHSRV
jgi:hypothetical protein